MISFAEKHPELVAEWALENEIRPDQISYGSNRKIIWNGRCGHTWKATIKNRGNNHGCPFCSGNQVLYGFNDLASQYPELVTEWSELNYPLFPTAVSVKANRKVWWKCRNCGQHWQARIADRTDGHGCPVCSGEKLVKGINDFATEHPNLAAEWSQMNSKSASEMWSKSRENVWWKCSLCGYEWRAVIDSRVKGLNCPACENRRVHTGFNDLLSLHPDIIDDWCTEKNGELTPDKILATSDRVVYWKGKCNHVWPQKISDHLKDRRCPMCRGLLYEELPGQMIRHYADVAGAIYKEYDVDKIGIPLQFYFPYHNAAIEFYYKDLHDSRPRRRWENAKNWLCLNSGIRLVRILSHDAVEFDNCICIKRTNDFDDVLEMAVDSAFKFVGIDVDINIKRDEAILHKGIVEGWIKSGKIWVF